MLIQKNIFRLFFSFRKYFYLCSPVGAMAERSGTGLQNLVQRFDSASHLDNTLGDNLRVFLFPAAQSSRS